MKKYQIGLRECMVLLILPIAMFCICSAEKPIDHSFDVPRPHAVFNLDSDTSYFYTISLGKRNWDSTVVCTSDFIDSAFMDSIFREVEK